MIEPRSLPTIEQANLERFWDVIRTLDPELFLIKVALSETGVNPDIIPRLIRGVSNIAFGTGWGKVQIFIQQGMVTQVKPEEWDKLNMPVIGSEN